MMFYGQSDHNIDDKGRLCLPSRYRSEFGTVVFLTLGKKNTIRIYTEKTHEQRMEKLATYDSDIPKENEYLLANYANTFPVDIDQQGRILLPGKLISQTDIDKKVTIVGMGDRLEIWNSEALQRKLADATTKSEALAEELALERRRNG